LAQVGVLQAEAEALLEGRLKLPDETFSACRLGLACMLPRNPLIDLDPEAKYF
jgi:hypothetical protein